MVAADTGVPVVLAGVVLFGFKNFQMKNLEQTYGLEDGGLDYF